MEKREESAVALAWYILYGEEYETIPDPNKPENVPYLKAKKKQRAQAFKNLMQGRGKVLFDQWKDKIRSTNLALLFIPQENLCTCPACQLIREVRGILEIWIEAEQALLEDKQKP